MFIRALSSKLVACAFLFLNTHDMMGVEVAAVASGEWSNPATWGGTPPSANDDVLIPAGFTVVLDANVECGGIIVSGILEVQRANRTLLCDYLLVQGAGSTFTVRLPLDKVDSDRVDEPNAEPLAA